MFMSLIVNIKSRNYEDWSIVDPYKNIIDDSLIPSDFHPANERLFHNDKITFDNGNCARISSEITHSTVLAGILILNNQKTFGRSSNNRLLYKCIPFSPFLPEFLVPYDQKLSFSKAISNKYVLFSFHNWEDKHPRGLLKETLGNIEDNNAFQEYTLHARNIHFSLSSFQKSLYSIIKPKPIPYFIDDFLQCGENIQDKRENFYVFTIDPEGSTDLDDGFSIQAFENNFKITIHIANVALWLEKLGMFSSMSKRTSTIYFPSSKKTMLPSILSEDWFSLLEKKDRLVFSMEVLVDHEGNIDEQSIRFYNAVVNVRKNFSYDSPKLLANKHYQKLDMITRKIDSSISDSHDVVSYWMIYMNTQVAYFLQSKKRGVFRNSKEIVDTNCPFSAFQKQLFSSYNQYSSEYVVYSDNKNDLVHESLQKKSYLHITSPIRRLVDILNQMVFQEEYFSKSFSLDASSFLSFWESNLSFVNESMKSIRKTQQDVSLLHLLSISSGLLTKTFSSIVLSCISNDLGWEYTLFIEELNFIGYCKSDNEYKINECVLCKLFLFEDDYNIKRKIRIQI